MYRPSGRRPSSSTRCRNSGSSPGIPCGTAARFSDSRISFRRSRRPCCCSTITRAGQADLQLRSLAHGVVYLEHLPFEYERPDGGYESAKPFRTIVPCGMCVGSPRSYVRHTAAVWVCTVTESTASAPRDPIFRARTGGDDRDAEAYWLQGNSPPRGPVLNAAPQEEHVTPLNFASAAFASLPEAC
jgi:hypothetical protein